MKLLVFAGNSRTGSWNAKLAARTARLAAAAGAQATALELAGFDVPMYNAELEPRGTPLDGKPPAHCLNCS